MDFDTLKFQDLEAKYNFATRKNGFNECEKRLRKRPNDLTYQLLKASLLMRYDGRKEAALDIIFQCCRRTPPITDPATIKVVHRLLAEAQRSRRTCPFTPEASSAVTTLWEAAVNASKDKAQTSKAYFLESIKKTDYASAQKALGKCFVHAPEPEKFRYLLLIYLVNTCWLDDEPAQAPVLEKDCQKRLKFIVQKFRGSKKDLPSELAEGALWTIFHAYEKSMDWSGLLQLLDDLDTEEPLKSMIEDPGLVYLRVSCFENLNRWDDLFKYSKNLIEKETSAFADDYKVWRAFFQSWESLGNAPSTDCIKFLDQPNRLRRSGRLSRIRHLSIGNDPGFDTEAERIAKYLEEEGRSNACFQDIRVLLEKSKDWSDILERIRSKQEAVSNGSLTAGKPLSALVQELNVLRCEGLFLRRQEKATMPPAAKQFVSKCFHFCDACGSSAEELACEAKLLVVVVLLDLDALGDNPKHSSSPSKLQALMLSREAVQSCDSFNPAKVLAIRLHMQFGLAREAFRYFSTLGAKESMFDTLSHIFFTRLSTVCLRLPDKDQDALEAMIKKNASMYRRMENQRQEKLANAISGPAFYGLPEYQEFRKRIEFSFSRELFELESRRIARTCDDSQLLMQLDACDAMPERFYDSRNVDRFSLLIPSNAGISQIPSNEENLFIGLYQMIEQTWGLMSSHNPEFLGPVATCRFVQGKSKQENSIDELTPSEWEYVEGWNLLVSLVNRSVGCPYCRVVVSEVILGDRWASPHDAKKSHDLSINHSKTLEALKKWITSHCQPPADDSVFPAWNTYHAVIFALDFLRGCEKFRNVALQRGQKLFGKDALVKLKSTIDTQHQLLKKWADEWKKSSSGRVADFLMEQVRSNHAGLGICKRIGEDWVRSNVLDLQRDVWKQMDAIAAHKL